MPMHSLLMHLLPTGIDPIGLVPQALASGTSSSWRPKSRNRHRGGDGCASRRRERDTRVPKPVPPSQTPQVGAVIPSVTSSPPWATK